MKKRCTNSSCRKVFSYQAAPLDFRKRSVSCPYCGKKYPRLLKAPHLRDVKTGHLISLGPFEKYLLDGKRIKAFKYLRTEMDISLFDAKIFWNLLLNQGQYPSRFISKDGKLFLVE